MDIIIPPRLKKGDCIGIIAPSSWLAAIFPHRLLQWIKTLEALWFKVKLSKNASWISGYVSGSIEERVADIHDLFQDSEVSAVISMIWGNHSNQLLKYLDFELIRNNSKIFIGYSDITVLHYAFYTQANLRTYYGPCIMTQFWEYPDILEYSWEYFVKALMEKEGVIWEILPSEMYTDEILDWVKKEDTLKARSSQKNEWYKWLRNGISNASIIGGCIPSVNHLVGTKYWISPENKIFFIDIPEWSSPFEGLSIADLDSYFADLDNLWLFQQISWLVIWRPYKYTIKQEEQLFLLIEKYTRKTDYPILYNVNIWHSDPIITLPFWSFCTLDSNENLFSIDTL